MSTDNADSWSEADTRAGGTSSSLLEENARELRVSSEFRNGHQVREFVRDSALNGGMPVEAVADLLLAVTEVFNNAVEHAHRFEAGREITVRVHHLEQALRIDVADQGSGFQPAEETHPAQLSPTQRGLGLLLARTLVDEITFTDGVGTTVHLLKQLPA